MCTVLLRVAPGETWPVLLGAVRDEFVERPWDPPGRHWEGEHATLIGGRDRTAGGTWLAVDPHRRAVAALLNGWRRDPLPDGGARPTRGTLALDLLASGDLPTDLTDYDRFHLLRADVRGAELWTWDGEGLIHAELAAGTHIIVNLGLDMEADPLVPHFRPLLAALPEPADDLAPAWRAWTDLLRGDGLDPGDERALIVRKDIDGRAYGTTSSTLMALSADAVRYAFTRDPRDPSTWWEVPVLSGVQDG